MTQYERGVRFERQVKKKWEDDGFWVMRSAGSKGKVDLVAIKVAECSSCELNGAYAEFPDVFLIQCKLGGVISSKDKDDLLLLAMDLGAKAVVAFKPGRGQYDEIYL